MGRLSKRVTSRMRHKIDRKKRDTKRDMRKAAKAMKKSGMKVKSRKSREMAKAVLRVSNRDNQKEEMLERLIEYRENEKMQRRARRHESKLKRQEAGGDDVSEDGSEDVVPRVASLRKQAETRKEKSAPKTTAGEHVGNFPIQLRKALFISDGVLMCVDARAPVQSISQAILSLFLEEAEVEHPKHVFFVLAKTDLVSVPALKQAIGALEEFIGTHIPAEVRNRYHIAPFTIHFDRCITMFAKYLRTVCGNGAKLAVVGLPSTGKSEMCRSITAKFSDFGVVPCRVIKMDAETGFVVHMPGKKNITLVTIADDEKLRRCDSAAGDVMFHSERYVWRMKDPEAVASVLVEGFDMIDLCQQYNMSLKNDAGAFLWGVGRQLRRAKRKHKNHADKGHPLKLGARQFIMDYVVGKDWKWAVAPEKGSKKRSRGGAEHAAPYVDKLIAGDFTLLPKEILTVKPGSISPEDFDTDFQEETDLANVSDEEVESDEEAEDEEEELDDDEEVEEDDDEVEEDDDEVEEDDEELEEEDEEDEE